MDILNQHGMLSVIHDEIEKAYTTLELMRDGVIVMTHTKNK